MTQYEIRPSVTEAGEPAWDLWRIVMNPLHCGMYKIATNANRAILEAAIKHLESAP